jgi:trigger factor
MQIEVTELEPCRLSVHYEANFLEISDKRAEVENAFKKAPVPGFRPGKPVPPDAIRVYYRQQIDDSLKRALAEDAFHNTLFEKKIRPHGAPRFNNLLLDGGKFTCDFEILTKPDFEIPDWKNMEVVKPHGEVEASVLAEKMMQELRVRLGEVSPYGDTDFVQSGDNVLIDYKGSVDGEVVESLVAEGEMITVGNSPLAAFDNNLLGMSLDETREFDFIAPAQGLPSLAGKTIHFVVTVKMGTKTVPCALDDEMAKKMGKTTFAELQETVAQAAFARSASMKKLAIQEAVARKLVDSVDIKVPNWMSLSEAQYLSHQSQVDWNTMPDVDREKMIEMAEQNVKLSLILDKIREAEPEAQLTDQEVFEIIKQNLANTKVTQSLDEVIQQMNKTGYLQILFSRIKDENTMDFIVKSIKLID